MNSWYAWLLLVVGLAQMAGDLFHLPILKGVAAATMCSPCPKVFTAHKGYETYSTKFIVEWKDWQGHWRSLPIDRAAYERIAGPYCRRKIFEAVVVHWPVAANEPAIKKMFQQVSKYALTGKAPLLRELGIKQPQIAGSLRIHFVPATGIDMGSLPRFLEVSCL
ncbi:MAG: hypothetical protein K2W82_09175 [Candidatus Obscuribacterales bacterium]|nr:hypothetical protein [Candidatus Obscuribacterales bacterium]